MSRSPRRPNVLLITADQLRPDALGCYGNKVCRTPNLDRLAESACLFENAFTPSPICVPARAAITTGNYPHVCTGFKDNTGRIRDDQVKIAEHFGRFGYRSYACGKLHYMPYQAPGKPRLVHGFAHCDLTESGRLIGQFDPAGKRRGLEDYFDYLADVGWGGYSRAHGVGNNDVRPCPTPLPAEHHVERWVADRTSQRLREHFARADGAPFFIWCSFPKPHAPLDPPAEYVARYDPRTIPPPAGDESMLKDRNPLLEAERMTHAIDSLSPAARQVIKAYYYALITFQDEQIGRVLSALGECGAEDDTLIVYTSDHGDLMGDFGMYFKSCFLNGSVRVPLLIRAPGLGAGQRRRQLVGLQDSLPTLAALADCPLDRPVQGLDISGAMGRPDQPLRELYYSQCGDQPRQAAMVTDGFWKYCYAQQGPTEELYDLQADPNELVNLASRPGNEALLQQWRGRLTTEARRLGDEALLEGDKLVTSPLDRAALAKLHVSGMGWRRY